jgi:hypothetical protein
MGWPSVNRPLNFYKLNSPSIWPVLFFAGERFIYPGHDLVTVDDGTYPDVHPRPLCTFRHLPASIQRLLLNARAVYVNHLAAQTARKIEVDHHGYEVQDHMIPGYFPNLSSGIETCQKTLAQLPTVPLVGKFAHEYSVTQAVYSFIKPIDIVRL